MELTAEGRQLHEKAITMFELVKEIRSEVGSGRHEEYKGEISLSTTHSVAANILAVSLARFHRLYPRTWFTLNSSGESSLTLDMVNSSAIDFGISARDEYPPTIEAQPCFLPAWCWSAVRKKASAATDRGFCAMCGSWTGESFVAFSSASVLSRVVHDELRRWGVTPPYRPQPTIPP